MGFYEHGFRQCRELRRISWDRPGVGRAAVWLVSIVIKRKGEKRMLRRTALLCQQWGGRPMGKQHFHTFQQSWVLRAPISSMSMSQSIRGMRGIGMGFGAPVVPVKPTKTIYYVDAAKGNEVGDSWAGATIYIPPPPPNDSHGSLCWPH